MTIVSSYKRNGVLGLLLVAVSGTTTARGELANLASSHERHAGGGDFDLSLPLEGRCAINENDDFPEGCVASENNFGPNEESQNPSNLTATNSDIIFVCEDYDDQCEQWARDGLCYSSQEVMRKECPLSCNECRRGENKDRPLPSWHYGLGDDLGMPQVLDLDGQGANKEAILLVIEQARVYLKEHDEELYGTDRCTNRHPMCAFWALNNECQNHEEYMIDFCAPVCGRCDDFLEEDDEDVDEGDDWDVDEGDDWDVDEEYDEDEDDDDEDEDDEDEDEDDDFDCFEGLVDAWQPGDIEKNFQRLTSEPFTSRYDVTILSSPDTTDGPWVISIDDAVSDEEAQLLIDTGTDIGYARSITTGAYPSEDGPIISSIRTSSTTWCYDECMADPRIHAILERLSDFAGLPSTNSEHLQFLKYELGEKYDVHHDMIPDHVEAPQGPRVLTAYIYLNDVPAGGGTEFDKLGLIVQPKRGKVVLWANVLDSDLYEADDRTSHGALPVEQGTKYGSNAWFHLSDFKTTQANECLDERMD